MSAGTDGPVPDLATLEELYRDLHRHPELSYAEHRTAAIAARHLADAGFRVTTGLARTGVVGVLANGPGPVVLLRADMDALPLTETTGLDYASVDTAAGPGGETVGVMHACGHDMHVTCLIGAVHRLAATRADWSGTVVALFQPAEEGGDGAQAMIDDGLYDVVPRPDIVLGQHVSVHPAGTVALRGGPTLAGADALTVTFYGRGGHGARPHTTVDPVVMAASAVVRLQTIVAREVDPSDEAVVTVGTLQAGSTGNVIPATAWMALTLRSFAESVRGRLVAAVERVVNAEAAASGAPQPPRIEFNERYPVTINDPGSAARLTDAFVGEFGPDRVADPGLRMASEDVGNLATGADAPLTYWYLGSVDPERFAAAQAAGTVASDLPSNHSPDFAPVVQPTLRTGVRALEVAARTWLAPVGRPGESTR